MARVEANYQAGDDYLANAQLDSALAAYLRARAGINDLFFMLINAKQKDNLSSAFVTRQWDLVLSKMQVQIDSLKDCEFDRCLIYREEKAVNWCLEILQEGKPERQAKLLNQLTELMERDAKSQLKNFFSKIHSWISLELSWRSFQKLQQPENQPSEKIESSYHKFQTAYARYRDQIS